MNRPGRAAILGPIIIMTLLTGCSSSLPASECPDGTYRGESAPSSDGEYATIEFTVEGNQVVSATFTVIDQDGNPHDSEYGRISGGSGDDQYYQRAQHAVSAEDEYAQQFVEVGDADQVDLIAGASISHDLFLDAVENAVAGCSDQ